MEQSVLLYKAASHLNILHVQAMWQLQLAVATAQTRPSSRNVHQSYYHSVYESGIFFFMA